MRAGWIRLGGVVVVLAGLLLNLGSGGGEDRTKAHVRLVNAATGYSELALTVGGEGVTGRAAYGESAAYTDIDPGTRTAEVSRPGSATLLATSSVALSRDDHYTVLAFDKAGTLSTLLLDENSGAPDRGRTLLRVVNAASDAGALDVYVTGDGEELPGSTPVQSAAAYGVLGSYVTLNSGSWRLRVTAASSKTDLRLNVPAVALGSESVATLVLTPGEGGVLVNALLVVQQGGIVTAANPQARVRVVAGVGDVSGGAAVTASVAGGVLMNAVPAPALTGYSLVSAGNVAVAASAGGPSAALTDAALVGGGDYTLLVYGAPDAPQAVMLADRNTLPLVASQAKLRLVNGLADTTDAASMRLDFVAVAEGVAQGAASVYADVDNTTGSRLDVSAGPAAVVSLANRDLLANSTYTLFVVGPAASATGILRKDR
jgi:hypothetical protein